jgi:Zn finger protein HypA/HybF involved in hydrogenase expression
LAKRLILFLFLLASLVPSASAQAGMDAAQAASRNPHGAITIPCESCHTFTSWKPIRSLPDFDHNKSRFPLRGMHQGVRCTQCHVMMQFQNAGTRCADCHADLHRGQFGGRCEQCHTVKGWALAVKSIQQHQNRFPLAGAHATVDCETCHKNGAAGQYTGLPTDCLACHTKEFQGVQDPNHQALRFPSRCQDCHTVNSWFGAKFDHLRFAHYALTGAHATLACSACHTNGQYQGTQANCYACHATDYNATSSPNHGVAAFPTDCSICHSTSAWKPAVFDHNQTAFPLTGAHLGKACEACHVQNGVPIYKGLGTACVTCHLSNYNGTTNPNHVQAGFPQTCEVCHSTSAWTPASFDHSKTAFPLTGAHTSVTCTNCHIGGVYAGTPTDCYSCHRGYYDGSNGIAKDLKITDPDHVAAGFSTACQTCHTTSTWSGATFNHTWFPIYSGKHSQTVWTNCSTCHTTPSNYVKFSCITACHTNKTDLAGKHSGVSGYSYTDTSCYGCHPAGVVGN